MNKYLIQQYNLNDKQVAYIKHKIKQLGNVSDGVKEDTFYECLEKFKIEY